MHTNVNSWIYYYDALSSTLAIYIRSVGLLLIYFH